MHPENYVDEVCHHIQEVIDQKVNGQDIVAQPEEAPRAKIIDIMESLKQSGNSNGKDQTKAKRAPKKTTQNAPANMAKEKTSTHRKFG